MDDLHLGKLGLVFTRSVETRSAKSTFAANLLLNRIIAEHIDLGIDSRKISDVVVKGLEALCSHSSEHPSSEIIACIENISVLDNIDIIVVREVIERYLKLTSHSDVLIGLLYGLGKASRRSQGNTDVVMHYMKEAILFGIRSAKVKQKSIQCIGDLVFSGIILGSGMTDELKELLAWIFRQEESQTVLRAIMTGLSRVIQSGSISLHDHLRSAIHHTKELIQRIWEGAICVDDRLYSDSLRTIGLIGLASEVLNEISEQSGFEQNAHSELLNNLRSPKTQVVVAALSSIKVIFRTKVNNEIHIRLEELIERTLSSLEGQNRWDFDSTASICGRLNVLSSSIDAFRELSEVLGECDGQRIIDLCATVEAKKLSRYNKSIGNHIYSLKQQLLQLGSVV
jgi:hypothetical protein